jgi:Transposase DDE domain
MSQQDRLSAGTATVAHRLPALHKPHARGLAALSLGLALPRRCTLRAVAEALAGLGKPNTVERRLQRFLHNPRLDWQGCLPAFAAWVLRSLGTPRLLVWWVDETSLQEHLKVMAVSLAYQGRAIPLAWWSYRPEAWPMGQVALIGTLLDWVAAGLPAGCRVLVEADRGLGTSPELLRAIQARGWYFLVRVQRQVHLRLANGRIVPFARLVPKAGRRWRGQVEAFKKAGWLRCWAVGLWRAPHTAPWLLLTNWPKARGQWYGWRMWEELAFRDFKSTGWQWQRSHVWAPEAANRLWLVMALAYVWVLSLGTRVLHTPAWYLELTRGRRGRDSVFALGRRWLTRWWALGRQLWYELWLISHLPPRPKSVVY